MERKLVRAVGSGLAVLLVAGCLPSGRIAWSPDSNKLVYEKDGNIYLLDILALEEQFLASGENNTILQIVWSPDGSLVICKRGSDSLFYDMQMHKEVSTPIVNEEYFELSVRP